MSATNGPFCLVFLSSAQPSCGKTHTHILLEAGTSPTAKTATAAAARPTPASSSLRFKLPDSK